MDGEFCKRFLCFSSLVFLLLCFLLLCFLTVIFPVSLCLYARCPSLLYKWSVFREPRDRYVCVCMLACVLSLYVHLFVVVSHCSNQSNFNLSRNRAVRGHSERGWLAPAFGIPSRPTVGAPRQHVYGAVQQVSHAGR